MMGINSASDKVKWAAVHFMETLPRVEQNVAKTAQNIDVTAHSIRYAANVFSTMLFLIGLAFVVYLYFHIRQGKQLLRRQLNRDYIGTHYGDDIEMRSKTYALLINFHSRLLSDKVSGGADDVKVVIIGGNEEVESRISVERHMFNITPFIFNDRSFTFNSMTEALQAVDDYCKGLPDASKLKRPKTLFIFLLISSQDPTIFGPHRHETFHMPSSLGDHSYVIIGTGFQGVAAHRLSRKSTGPNRKLLSQSLPMGPKAAGIEL